VNGLVSYDREVSKIDIERLAKMHAPLTQALGGK